MSHAAGDEVWSMTTHVAYDGIARAHVLKVKVAGVIEGVTVVRMPSGSITALREMGGILFDSEPEAWAAAARELAEARDRVQLAIDEAIAKAAGSRVGEAIAS